MNICSLKFDIDDLLKNNQLYESLKDHTGIQDVYNDNTIKVLYDRFRIFVEIYGIPDGALFQRLLQANFEVT